MIYLSDTLGKWPARFMMYPSGDALTLAWMDAAVVEAIVLRDEESTSVPTYMVKWSDTIDAEDSDDDATTAGRYLSVWS